MSKVEFYLEKNFKIHTFLLGHLTYKNLIHLQGKSASASFFFFLRRPIRFHCIIIKTRSCKLWSSSQTWLSTYHVKNKKKERLFIWNKGSSWSSKRRNKMAHFQPQCLEFPRKFVSQFMHVDTNVTHSCATITIVLHFTLSGISFCSI